MITSIDKDVNGKYRIKLIKGLIVVDLQEVGQCVAEFGLSSQFVVSKHAYDDIKPVLDNLGLKLPEAQIDFVGGFYV